MKKTYTAIIDQPDKQGRFWASGTTRILREEEARPLLERGLIIEAPPPESKRMVRLVSTEGKVEVISWSEHLKRRRAKEKILPFR